MLVRLTWLDSRNFQFLQSAQQFGNASQILQSLLIPRTFAEAPEVRPHFIRDAATLIRNSYDDVLGCLANKDLNGWWYGVTVLLLRNDCLDGIPDELANDIF